MTAIPFPHSKPRATLLTTTPVEGHLSILRRLFQRAEAKCGVLTPEECRMGAESVAALQRMLDEQHAERIRAGGCAHD